MKAYERKLNGYTIKVEQVAGQYNATVITPTGTTKHNDGWASYITALNVAKRMYRDAK